MNRLPKKKITIELPKFQRNLVWKEKNKIEFIESLKKGYPFGTLLLYKQEDKDDIFSLIDGLQRSSTIKDYYEQPTKYFPRSNIDDTLCKKILSYVDNNTSKNNSEDDLVVILKDYIYKWVIEQKSFDESDGFSASDLAEYLDEHFFNNELDKTAFRNIRKCLAEFTDAVKEESNINEVSIPVLVYYGDEENLPEIFELINSKGTKLNKYQIYSAVWNKTFKIHNAEIISMIKRKYDKAIEDGFEIKDYDPDNIDNADFNLFEYLFGLGKLLKKNYPLLFGRLDEKKIDTEEAISFMLVSICCGLSFDQMKNLEKKYLNKDQCKFEKALLESVDVTYEILEPYIAFKANSKEKLPVTVFHTDHQIISIIGTVFYLMYDQDLEKKENWIEIKKNLEKTLPLHYLYDIISREWRGATDRKVKQIVFGEGDNWNIDKHSKYLKPIGKESWDFLFKEWEQQQLDKKEKNRRKINPPEKLFLNFLYTKTMTFHQHSKLTFEYDHIFPLERLRKCSDDLPIRCVANFALISDQLNKKKKNKTFIEYYTDLVNKNELSYEKAAKELKDLEGQLFISPHEICFEKDSSGKDLISAEWFESKMRKRFDILKRKFYKLYLD